MRGCFAGGGGALAGMPASAASPLTESVLILRGSLLGIVPFAAMGGGGVVGETLATDGGLLFGFSGGNTTRGPVFAVDIDRRFLARDKLFSAVAGHHAVWRLGDAVGRRRDDLGRAVVGLDDRRLAAARRADIGAVGERSPRSHHGQRQHGGHRHQAAARLRGAGSSSS